MAKQKFNRGKTFFRTWPPRQKPARDDVPPPSSRRFTPSRRSDIEELGPTSNEKTTPRRASREHRLKCGSNFFNANIVGRISDDKSWLNSGTYNTSHSRWKTAVVSLATSSPSKPLALSESQGIKEKVVPVDGGVEIPFGSEQETHCNRLETYIYIELHSCNIKGHNIYYVYYLVGFNYLATDNRLM